MSTGGTTQPSAAGVPADGSGAPVPDVIEGVLELLAGNGGPVLPKALAGDHLAESIISRLPSGIAYT